MPQPPWFVRLGQGRHALRLLVAVSLLAAAMSAVVAGSGATPADLVTAPVRVREVVSEHRGAHRDDGLTGDAALAAEWRHLRRIQRMRRTQQDELAEMERELRTRERRLDEREDDVRASERGALSRVPARAMFGSGRGFSS